MNKETAPVAEEKFSYLLKNFSNHRKMPDAKFKLAKVYFQQGKKSEAKVLAQEIAAGNSQAANLAKTFLKTNF